MRWARIALGALAVVTVALIGPAPSGATTRPATNAAPLTLEAQTPWVQATAPWFHISLAVGEQNIPARQLRVSMTFYGRINDASQLQQDMTGTPQNHVLQRVSNLAVTTAGETRVATACVTVLPDETVTPPATAPSPGGACLASDPIVLLGCKRQPGACGDVYPVSVALVRQGSSNPLTRVTTFLTYEEPAAVSSTGGALRVGLVVPVTASDQSALVSDLAGHHQVPVTLVVSPRTVVTMQAHGVSGARGLRQLGVMTTPGTESDQLLSQPYVPINLAALEQGGLGGEIAAQLDRGGQILRQAELRSENHLWLDTSTNLTAATAGSLASGLGAASARTVVLSDTDLVPSQAQNYTFAQPFTLNLTRTDHVTALAANSSLSSRFTAEPADPVLAANQLLAGLSFVHFENAYAADPRGVVVAPPSGWRASSPFVNALLAGLSGNPALSPVTIDQLLSQVPGGGNNEPTSRRLQSGGTSTGGFTKSTVQHITLARQHLASFVGAVTGHPAIETSLLDQLLSTEAAGLSTARRSGALAAYDRQFNRVLSSVTLATERTVTFTARTAAIPITILSSAPYPVKVVLTVQSDKFTFPGGASRTLVLDRPTTPVRVQAQSRTSGDRLPVDVTLRTPDGQLLIARTTLTVHSTAISGVGIALTVVALLVLLMWWARTWRRSRRQRPRAH
jgi:hypothetical protein